MQPEVGATRQKGAMSEKPLLLLLDDNLLTASRVQASLAPRYTVKLSRQLPAAALEPQAVVINLGSRSLGGLELIARSREQYPSARVVGFCGHKEIEIRRAAKAASIARIFTNEEAHTGLPGLENVAT